MSAIEINIYPFTELLNDIRGFDPTVTDESHRTANPLFIDSAAEIIII